jgi:hypothetical protein
VRTNRLAERVTIVNCAISGSAGVAAMDAASGIPSQYKRIHSEATKDQQPLPSLRVVYPSVLKLWKRYSKRERCACRSDEDEYPWK